LVFYSNLVSKYTFRRIKAGVLKLGGMKTNYIRFYEVLPNMPKDKFDTHMNKVRSAVRKL